MGLGSYRTAWMMLHRFRVAMVRPGREQLAGRVEVFDKTRTSLRTWFAAAWFVTSQKHGLRALDQSVIPSCEWVVLRCSPFAESCLPRPATPVAAVIELAKRPQGAGQSRSPLEERIRWRHARS